MLSRTLMALLVVLPLLSGCEGGGPVSPSNELPAFAPAGNDNKFVFPIHEELSDVCTGGAEVNVVIDGWVQGRFFQQANNKNVLLQVFHSTITFTNQATGETFVFRDVGPDHYSLDKDGNLVVAITGRSTGSGVIGHVVINIDTDEVLLVAGKEFGNVFTLGCEAVT